jgi:hypothetical protein
MPMSTVVHKSWVLEIDFHRFRFDLFVLEICDVVLAGSVYCFLDYCVDLTKDYCTVCMFIKMRSILYKKYELKEVVSSCSRYCFGLMLQSQRSILLS